MQEHLSDRESALALAGCADTAVRSHLEKCSACACEQNAVFAALAAYSAACHGASERPGGFWLRQRMQIAEKIRERERCGERVLWAMALAGMVMASALVFRPTRPAPRTPAEDTDQILLMEVEDSAAQQVPTAVRPALLLTQELDRIVNKGFQGADRHPKGERR